MIYWWCRTTKKHSSALCVNSSDVLMVIEQAVFLDYDMMSTQSHTLRDLIKWSGSCLLQHIGLQRGDRWCFPIRTLNEIHFRMKFRTKTIGQCTTCGLYFGTKFEGAQFFLCLIDWNDSTCRRQTKYSDFVFMPDKRTSACVYKTFLREPMKVAEISSVLFVSCSNAPKCGKKCDEFKSLYQNIFKLFFVDISVSFKEKQHHFKFHFTWARGTRFGEGPLLAVHLSESVSPFARNFPTWKQICSPAQGLKTSVKFVS